MRSRIVPVLVATLMLAACAHSAAQHAIPRPASPSTGSIAPGKPRAIQSPLPTRGWTDNVVRAGPVAYVEGWRSLRTGALWAVDAEGTLSARTAPPGAPGNPSVSNEGIYDLTFGDADHGLAITGIQGDRRHAGHRAAYATDDGARTWTRIGLPPDALPDDITVGGGKEYVLASNCLTPLSACNHATLWTVDPTNPGAPRTVDTLPTPANTAGPIAVTAYGDSVWILLNMGTGQGTALHSADGGRTWQPWKTETCLRKTPEATSADVVWSTCGTGMMEHFTRQATGGPDLGVFTEVGGTTSSTLDPFDDQTAYALLDDSAHGATIHATSDAGRTSRIVGSIPRPIDRDGFQATFISPTIGFLVTRNGGQLYRTADHGKTWTNIPPPSTDRHR